MHPPTPSELIRRVRESRHLSVKELAALLGYSSATVEAWERGEPVPPEAIRRLIDLTA